MARSHSQPSRGPPTDLSGEASGGVELRLAIGRDGVGLELASPVTIGCLRVVHLRTTLPALRFPADVSGGVTRFRHKRAELQRLQAELEARAVERWATTRLRGVVSERAPEVWIRVARAHATICVSEEQAVARLDAMAPALAFDVHAIVHDDDIMLIVSSARGVHLPAPATALAVACVEAMLARHARRAGVEFTVPAPATALLRAILPDAGARAASTRGVRWTIDSGKDDGWTLLAERGVSSSEPTSAAQRAQEGARLLRRADDALVAGDLQRARGAYMEALERAPRHPEIVQRIADIDVRTPGREEAVLGLMSESAESTGPSPFAVTRSELLARIGRTDAAMAAFEEAVAAEPSPALGARLCELAAAQRVDLQHKEFWLDRALAASPRTPAARWSRVLNRLQLGRASDALGDVQHLDALSHGDRERYDVWMRAGMAWRSAGLAAQAATLYERALLNVPDEPEALAGLGATLVEMGATARGTQLLVRALDVADGRRQPTGAILIELSRALAEKLDDLPAAIARVAAVPREAPQAILARGLEGRWRAQLGDLAGASLAFATMREMASSLAGGVPHGAPFASPIDRLSNEVLMLLREGAELETTHRPHDLTDEGDLADPERSHPLGRMSFEPELDPSPEVLERASRVEELIRSFQANPDDQAVATELSGLLESLGRSHELLALLSARLEDALPDERAALVPRVRAALERLAAVAEEAGRAGEATLYRDAIRALVP
jgi:tetratricopeptide (TPR) repeat protein